MENQQTHTCCCHRLARDNHQLRLQLDALRLQLVETSLALQDKTIKSYANALRNAIAPSFPMSDNNNLLLEMHVRNIQLYNLYTLLSSLSGFSHAEFMHIFRTFLVKFFSYSFPRSAFNTEIESPDVLSQLCDNYTQMRFFVDQTLSTRLAAAADLPIFNSDCVDNSSTALPHLDSDFFDTMPAWWHQFDNK